MQNNARILGAEMVGTAVLIMGGVGSAILIPGSMDPPKQLAVSLAFGLSVLVMFYAIGPVSGCHINPAVTLGMWLTRKVNGYHAFFAMIGQIVGAAIGGFIIWRIAAGVDTFERGSFDSNGFADKSPGGYGLGSVIVMEVIFTALLVFVMLFSTGRRFSLGFGGLVVGLTYALIHIVTIQVDNTSLNPARSFGTAIYATSDSDAFEQLWVFIIFPLIGAVVGIFLWLMLDESRLEGTMLDSEALRKVRDVADDAVDSAIDASTGLVSEDD